MPRLQIRRPRRPVIITWDEIAEMHVTRDTQRIADSDIVSQTTALLARADALLMEGNNA